MTDTAAIYALAIETASEHLMVLKRHASTGRALAPADVSGLVDILRVLAPKGHKQVRHHKADLSGKSVRQMLEEAAKEFPEIGEAFAAMEDS